MTGRTWDDPGGPMVEPPPDEEIGRRARAIIDRLDAQTRRVMEIQGRRVSDRLAREATERGDRISASHAVSAAHRWGERPRPRDEVDRARASVNGRVDERLLALYRGGSTSHDDDELTPEDSDVQEQVQ